MSASSVTASMISVVEDDDALRESLAAVFAAMGIQVSAFASAEDYLAAPTKGESCLVADLELPGQDGAALTRVLQKRDPKVPVILISGTVRADLLANAESCGARMLLRKPFDPMALVEAVRKTMPKHA